MVVTYFFKTSHFTNGEASGLVMTQFEIDVTITEITALGIDTSAILTNSNSFTALIDIFTKVCQWVLFLSNFAFADVRADIVNALASNAQTRNCFAFIHILARIGLRVEYVSAATRVRLVNTLFTWVTPCFSDCSTTEGFGTNHPSQLAFAL